MKLLRHIAIVLWSFFGIGRRKNENELAAANPLLLIAAAFVLVAMFLGTLVFVVFVVAT